MTKTTRELLLDPFGTGWMDMLGKEDAKDPMPCKVCYEPFVDYDTKLCADHYTELVESMEYKHGEKR